MAHFQESRVRVELVNAAIVAGTKRANVVAALRAGAGVAQEIQPGVFARTEELPRWPQCAPLTRAEYDAVTESLVEWMRENQ